MLHWMLDLGNQLRLEISSRPWRTQVCGDNLAWAHQLAWQSVEFTQALGLQWSLSNDLLTRDTHADHAADEARHPEQLRAWMAEQNLLVEAPFLSVPPTDETVMLLSFNTRVALREPHPVRVGVLNVLGEGVALDFFTAAIDALADADLRDDRIGGRPDGLPKRLGAAAKFWRIHKAVDGDHLMMGLSELGDLQQASSKGRNVERMMRLGARCYGDALDSWFTLVKD